MKNNKSKNKENAKDKQQKSNNAVNSTTNSFDLEKHSLDHEIKAEEIGFVKKR